MTTVTICSLSQDRQQLVHERMILVRQWGALAPDRVQARIDDLTRQIERLDADLQRLVASRGTSVLPEWHSDEHLGEM